MPLGLLIFLCLVAYVLLIAGLGRLHRRGHERRR